MKYGTGAMTQKCRKIKAVKVRGAKSWSWRIFQTSDALTVPSAFVEKHRNVWQQSNLGFVWRSSDYEMPSQTIQLSRMWIKLDLYATLYQNPESLGHVHSIMKGLCFFPCAMCIPPSLTKRLAWAVGHVTTAAGSKYLKTYEHVTKAWQ